MAISSDTVSGAPISAEGAAGIYVRFIMTSILRATIVTNEDILLRTEKNVLVFSAELSPWVLTR